jgi:hypothetical protein
MAGRPAKSAKILKMTNDVSHRTKKEIAVREAAEESTLSGYALQERPDVAADPIAHAEFLRVQSLLQAIEKDDDLYGRAINDYCRLSSECAKVEERIAKIDQDLEYLEERRTDMDDEFYFKVRNDLYGKQDKLETVLDRKRASMRSIEDKNLMNIASALRSIPKQPETKTSALREALFGTG